MNKMIKGLAVGLMTLGAMVGLAMSTTEVRADVIPTPAPTDRKESAVLTKELKIPEGITVPELTFTFVADKLGTEDADNVVTADSTQPDWDIPPIEFGKGDEPKLGQTGDKAVKSTEDLMPTIKGLTFTHAGVYLYKVTEVDGTDSKITHYSEAKYIVRVYVENAEDESGNPIVVVKGLTVQKIADDLNASVNKKVDPTPDPDDNGDSEFRFVNDFWDKTNLEIEKKVVGASADLTKKFDFEITLNLPTVVNAPSGNVIKYVLSSDPGTEITYDESNPIKVSLKNGETIKFTNLPVGSTYAVIEKGYSGYTATAVVTGRGTNGTAVDGVENTDYNVTVGTTTALLVDAEDDTTKNKTTVTNTYKTPNITGVIIDNLPFILMVVVAGAGITFLTISKRRRAH